MNINALVKRKQYLWLGIVIIVVGVAVGGGLYLSELDLRSWLGNSIDPFGVS